MVESKYDAIRVMVTVRHSHFVTGGTAYRGSVHYIKYGVAYETKANERHVDSQNLCSWVDVN